MVQLPDFEAVAFAEGKPGKKGPVALAVKAVAKAGGFKSEAASGS